MPEFDIMRLFASFPLSIPVKHPWEQTVRINLMFTLPISPPAVVISTISTSARGKYQEFFRSAGLQVRR
jgi:hypothetical protein